VPPELPWQPSLLDVDTDVELAPAPFRRLQLDTDSWLDHGPAWLRGADALLEELLRSANWTQRRVRMYDAEVDEPRLTAGYSSDVDAAGMPPVLVELSRALSQRYDVTFDRIWMNLYRDGRDSVAWHGDRNRHVMTRPLVATLTLGATRRFCLRRAGQTRTAHVLAPAHGDVLVMGGNCQSAWQHAVPKTAAPVGPRISVTIRHSRPAPGERWLRPPTSEEPGHAW
jgi:alkylated DNA repair dioxygenase AlkB